MCTQTGLNLLIIIVRNIIIQYWDVQCIDTVRIIIRYEKYYEKY